MRKKTISMTFFLTFLIINMINAQDWQSQFSCLGIGNSSATGAKLEFIGNTPYLAFQDSNMNYKVSVMKKSDVGNNYSILGTAGFSAGLASYIATGVANNQLYVAYRDGGNGNKASVMKFDGTNWITVGLPGFSPGIVDFTTLSFIGSTPYIAFKDSTNGGKSTVMAFNGTSWDIVGVAGFSANAVDEIQMKSDGTFLYVVYGDFANANKITVQKFDGSNWIVVGAPGFSVGVATAPQLDFAGATPYVAYIDGSLNNKATVMKFDGLNWINVGNPGFTFGSVTQIQLAINNTIPYVTFGDITNCGFQNQGRRGSAMKFNGTNWENYGSSCFTSTSINVFNTIYSLVFNNNVAHVLSSTLCSGLYTKMNLYSYDTNLSIDKSEIERVLISPNPAQNFLNIETQETIKEVYIYNLLGEKVIVNQISNDTIDVSNLAKGVYLIKIISENDKTFISKFIKQ